MAIRNILTEENPRLRNKSKNVPEITNKIIQLLDDMAETMKQANGVGLAAPQVGILKRIVVIDVGEGLIELINPEIIRTDGKQIGDEGCLSVPDKSGVVVRPLHVTVSAMNRNGEKIEISGTDLLARAICHELDHLDGILYVDHVVAESMDQLSDDEVNYYLGE